VLAFYNDRNGSTNYSAKLLAKTEKIVSLVTVFPELGHLTENKVTRVIVKGDFLIFYEVSDYYIEVVSFWDSRQDPSKRIDLL
jgi:ParE toxin of type II toxin-antitoxin system, parDE